MQRTSQACGGRSRRARTPCAGGARQATSDEQLFLLRLVARASGQATDQTEALRAVLHAVCQATGWLLGQAWLPRPDGAVLERGPAWHAAYLDGRTLRRAPARRTVRRGVGLAGRAWSTGQPQWGGASGWDSRTSAQARAAGLTTGAAIPVWGGDEVVAVLEFFGSEPAEDGRLKGLLLVISAQVGALLQRIRLEGELRRAEAERAALLAAEQERSAQLRELGELKADFTAMVAHELGGPLAAIRALADTLATGALSPEQHAATLATIQTEARLLTALVADVQTAASTERDDFDVQPRPVRVGVLLDEAAAHGKSLPGDHPLTITGATETPVRADPERIGQVLRNLVGNAAKYSPPGAPIELRATRRGGRVRLEVADRGFGIRPEDRPRIFDKFGRGQDEHGRRVVGAGLGLYLSRRILRAHGSELTVTSTPGEGAVFGFALEVVS